MASLTDAAWTVAQIVFVNIVLSGDNALVIALTAQRLPAPMRRQAVLLGSALAVLLQVAFAIVVGRLLDVPGLRLAGAIALVLIVRKLVCQTQNESDQPSEVRSTLGAVVAILFANLAMSFDNVLAVGALSRGMPSLIALGLVVSAVVLLGASSLVMALVERFHWLTFAGAVLLACTAASMVCQEPLLAGSRIAGPQPVLADSASALDSVDPDASVTEHVAVTSHADVLVPTLGLSDPMTARWSFAVYGVVLTLCFGNLRWWHALQSFDRDRETAVVEEEPACVQA